MTLQQHWLAQGGFGLPAQAQPFKDGQKGGKTARGFGLQRRFSAFGMQTRAQLR